MQVKRKLSQIAYSPVGLSFLTGLALFVWWMIFMVRSLDPVLIVINAVGSAIVGVLSKE